MGFIKGNFKKYIFKSNNNYVVGLFKVKDSSEEYKSFKNKVVTFTGYFGLLNESDLYILNGEMTVHERYGEQFSVSSYEITLPNDKDNIIEFLSSNLFPGIGLKKASDIVSVLGNNCLEIIMTTPDNLFLVPKVTKKQRDVIYNNLVKYQKSYKIIVELNKKGFSTKDGLSIYNYYKDDAMNVVLENVYTLIDDIIDIGFKKVDSIRSNFEIKDNDLRRVEAGIKYVMRELSYRTGNTYFSINEIIVYTNKVLFLDDNELILSSVSSLISNGDIVLYNDMYYLKKMYEAESYIAKRIFDLANSNLLYKVHNKSIEKVEDYFKIKYDPLQLKAIKSAIESNFLVITGGPGTGKTTIIKAICKLYQEINEYSLDDLNKNLALLAPTGRASKRISEQTTLKASTIHRFLKWNKEDDTFCINEDKKSDVKFVIVDEASMVDTYLLYNLLLGLKKQTKIILIGDYNQLPSVGPGQVLKDIIDSSCVSVINLEKLYRQDEDSNINLFAHDIQKGVFDFSLFNSSSDLTFVPANSSNFKEKLYDYICYYKDLSIDKFQVLAPLYKGDNGIDELNYFVQNLVNKKSINKQEITANGITFREGDKVLELVNVVDENIFNGDIGKILKVSSLKNKEMIVDFDSNIVRFTANNFLNIKLGYVISIHKSQGSEFDVVVIPMLHEYRNMLYRKLIYTASTRAKKHLIIIGEIDALKRAISNEKEISRKTNLKNFIISCIK